VVFPDIGRELIGLDDALDAAISALEVDAAGGHNSLVLGHLGFTLQAQAAWQLLSVSNLATIELVTTTALAGLFVSAAKVLHSTALAFVDVVPATHEDEIAPLSPASGAKGQEGIDTLFRVQGDTRHLVYLSPPSGE
jgi:hypothetical protein